jgi:hypothetical protein
VDLWKKRKTDRLPELPQTTKESQRAAREIQGEKADKFKGKKDEYPEANGPASGNTRRTYAPQVQKTKPKKKTNQVDDEGFETVQKKTPSLTKPQFKKANLSDLLDLLENNI